MASTRESAEGVELSVTSPTLPLRQLAQLFAGLASFLDGHDRAVEGGQEACDSLSGSRIALLFASVFFASGHAPKINAAELGCVAGKLAPRKHRGIPGDSLIREEKREVRVLLAEV